MTMPEITLALGSVDMGDALCFVALFTLALLFGIGWLCGHHSNAPTDEWQPTDDVTTIHVSEARPIILGRTANNANGSDRMDRKSDMAVRSDIQEGTPV